MRPKGGLDGARSQSSHAQPASGEQYVNRTCPSGERSGLHLQGVGGFSPHDLRRTYISNLLDAGADIVSVQGLVRGQWTVQRGHGLLEEVEADIRNALSGITVFTHLKPLEDPTPWDDMQLDRARTTSPAEAARVNGRSDVAYDVASVPRSMIREVRSHRLTLFDCERGSDTPE